MNLNNLKPAWQRLRVLNSMQPFDQHEILVMLEQAEERAISRSNRFLVSSVLFIALTFCCQGG